MNVRDWMTANSRPAELARLASLAAEVEPELLRALRIELLPRFEADIEADVWFSPLVESRSPAAIVFSNEALQELWTDMPLEKLEAARGIVKKYHQGITPLIELHEEIVFLALSKRENEVKEKLKCFLSSVIHPEYANLTKWAARALPRMPSSVRTVEEDEQRLWNLSSQALFERGAPVNGATGQAAPAWLVPSLTEETTLGVRLFGREIEIVHPPASDTMTITMAGGFPGRLIYDLDPAFPSPRALTIRSSATVRGSVPSGQTVYLRSPGGKTYAIEPIRHEEGLPTLIFGFEERDDHNMSVVGDDRLFRLLESKRVRLAPFDSTSDYSDIASNSMLLWATTDLRVSKGKRSYRRAIWAGIPIVFLRLPLAEEDWVNTLEDGDIWVDFSDEGDWEAARQELLAVVQRPRPKLGALNGVPPLPWHYVRTSDEDLVSGSIINQSSPLLVTITGEAGSGKSTCLSALARRADVRESFPNGVYWLDREDPSFQAPTSQTLVICDFPVRPDFALTHYSRGSTVIAISADGRSISQLSFEIGRFVYEDALTFLISVSDGAIPGGFKGFGIVNRQILALAAACSKISFGFETLFTAIGSALESDGLVSSGTTPKMTERSKEILRKFLTWEALLNRLRASDIFSKVLEDLLNLMPDAPITHAGINRIKPFRDLVTPNTIERLTEFALCTRVSQTCFSMNVPQVNRKNSPSSLEGFESAPIEEPWVAGVIGAGTHRQIVSTFGPFDPIAWQGMDDAGYGMRAMVWHLVRAGKTEMARSLVLDLDWLLSKLSWGGVSGVIEDYRIAEVFHTESQLENFEAELAGAAKRGAILALFREEILLPDRIYSINLQARATARPDYANGHPPQWVLVAGTGTEELPEAVRKACVLLGRELARAGYGLISGGWPGVDQYVCQGYIPEAERLGVDPSAVLRLITNITTPAIWYVEGMKGKGKLEYSQGERDAVYQSVREADALIVVGGLGGTEEIAAFARERHLPVVPVRGTGQYADKVDYNDWYPEERRMRNEPIRFGEDIWHAVEFAMLNLMREFRRPRNEA